MDRSEYEGRRVKDTKHKNYGIGKIIYSKDSVVRVRFEHPMILGTDDKLDEGEPLDVQYPYSLASKVLCDLKNKLYPF